MTTTGRRLAAVQYRDGHLAIDAIYAPLSAAIAEMVMRYAVPASDGVARLSLASRFAFTRDLERLIVGIEPALVRLVIAAVTDAQLAAPEEPDRTLLDDAAALAAIGLVAARSLRANRGQVVKQTDRVLVRGIGQALPAPEVAKNIADYFNPWFATRRSATGGLLRAGREGAVSRWPGHAGMASQHLRGVMLFETTAGHGRAMTRLAIRNNEGLRWRTSPKHAEVDVCTAHATADVGWGPGVYAPDQFPSVPSHFRCRCYGETASLVAR